MYRPPSVRYTTSSCQRLCSRPRWRWPNTTASCWPRKTSGALPDRGRIMSSKSFIDFSSKGAGRRLAARPKEMRSHLGRQVVATDLGQRVAEHGPVDAVQSTVGRLRRRRADGPDSAGHLPRRGFGQLALRLAGCGSGCRLRGALVQPPIGGPDDVAALKGEIEAATLLDPSRLPAILTDGCGVRGRFAVHNSQSGALHGGPPVESHGHGEEGVLPTPLPVVAPDQARLARGAWRVAAAD